MNWGNKLLVAFLGFAGGMSFLVYRSVKTDFELVEKDYYKKEIVYQQVIDGTQRANELGTVVEMKQTSGAVLISLPAEMKGKFISGTALFYCAYDQKKDRTAEWESADASAKLTVQVVLSPGTYTGKLQWYCEGRNYYAEKQLVIQ